MSSSSNLGNLETARWQQLQEIADRFEKAWQGSETTHIQPILENYLPPSGDALRLPVLMELVKTDLEIRWRRGYPLGLEEYLQKFPELGTGETISPQMLYEEFRVRQLYGDQPPLALYQTRFPVQFAALNQLIQEQPLPTAGSTVHTPTILRTSVPVDPGPPATLNTSGSEFLAKYKKIKRLGRGGFGEVWLYEAPGGVPVAIKKIFQPLDHDESKRELESLNLIRELRHPFLLATQAFDQNEDRLFIVMELADGSLRDRAKEYKQAGQRGIPLAELITYFREASDALDYLHSKGVLHRDIKPDNILTLQKHTKLADFGLARLYKDQERSMTASGSGTLAYMAPEVWRGKVSKASDLYSLAITYAELRLDHRLFQGSDMMEMMMNHLERQPVLDPLPAAEQRVLLKALAKDPHQRYESCSAWIQELELAVAAELGRGPASIPVNIAPVSASDDAMPTARLDQLASRDLRTEALDPNVIPTNIISAPPPTAQPERQETGWLHHEAPTQFQKLESPATKQVDVPVLIPRSTPTAPVRKKWLVPTVLAGSLLVAIIVGAIVFGHRSPKDGQVAATDKNGKTTPAEVDYLPPSCRKAPDAEVVLVEGKRLYNRIDYVLPNETRIRFLLIPKRKNTDPETFYIMEDKVSVALFKEFAKENPKAITDSRWKEGSLVSGEPTKNQFPRHPVMNVTVDDAWRFANWLKGDLPSVEQWDKAAGAQEDLKGEGPYQPKAADEEPIAVNRGEVGPLDMSEAGKAIKDRSPLGPRYMAGNGLEWTRDVAYDVVTKRVPLSLSDKENLRNHPGITCLVLLRGRNYMEGEPYRYADSARKKESQDYKSTTPYTSFRVILEVP